jgi:molecular chaperone GrpE
MLSTVLQSNLLRWEQMVRNQQRKNAPLEQSEEDDERREVASLPGALSGLLAQNKSLEDKNAELLAEINALRQRNDRDKDDFKKYAISEFAADIIGVADNMRRAIEAIPKEQIGAIPALNSLMEGFEVTERSLLSALNRHRVTRFDPQGEPFNPHLHEAASLVSASDLPANTVAHVIHAGYMIGERLLRPAAVMVTQASAAAAESPENGAAQACKTTANASGDPPPAHHAVAYLAFSNGVSSASYAQPADGCDRGGSLLHKPIIAFAEPVPAANHQNCDAINGKPHGALEDVGVYASEPEWCSFPEDDSACETIEISFTSDPATAVKAVNDAFESKNYAEAARLQQRIAAALNRAETAAEGKPGDGALGALLSLSWYQLFAGQYGDVIATANLAAEISEDYISIDTNRAHALMLKGFADEAKDIYGKHRGKETQNRKTWEREILDDFAEMEHAGITHPLMDEIRAAWTAQN